MKTLQCHTKGDKRFSPFCCYVEAFGIKRSIEDHYQTAKRFKDQAAPKDWREAKAMQKADFERIGFELPNGLWLPPDTTKADDLAIQFYQKITGLKPRPLGRYNDILAHFSICMLSLRQEV